MAIKAGDTITAYGYKWDVLVPKYQGKDGIGVLCLAKEPVKDMPFSKEDSNEYELSDIRKYLENEFTEQLEARGADFKTIRIDIIADDGTGWEYPFPFENKGPFLLTDTMYRKYRRYITDKNKEWWTATPCSFTFDFTYWIRTINNNGTCGTLSARELAAVVPACLFTSVPEPANEVDELKKQIAELQKKIDNMERNNRRK